MKKKIKKSEVCAIIVYYYADKKNFKKILKLHSANFSKIIILNNSPKINISEFKNYKITIINNKKNIGLAKAINKGIVLATKKNFSYFALFDQDSLIDQNFLSKMLKYMNLFYKDKKLLNVQPSVFSPIYFNKITNEQSQHIKFKFLRLSRESNNVKNIFSFPEYVITSGSIIPLSSIKKVGLMKEKLFIDFIDIEWCLRAKKFKKIPVTFNRVKIKHFIGDYCLNLNNNKFPIHGPKRMYYYFRNSIYLYKKKYIDMNWKIIDISRNIFRIFFYLLFVNKKKSYLKYISLGLLHGFKGKMGNYK